MWLPTRDRRAVRAQHSIYKPAQLHYIVWCMLSLLFLLTLPSILTGTLIAELPPGFVSLFTNLTILFESASSASKISSHHISLQSDTEQQGAHVHPARRLCKSHQSDKHV